MKRNVCNGEQWGDGGGDENGEDCRAGSFTVRTEHKIVMGWSDVT